MDNRSIEEPNRIADANTRYPANLGLQARLVNERATIGFFFFLFSSVRWRKKIGIPRGMHRRAHRLIFIRRTISPDRFLLGIYREKLRGNARLFGRPFISATRTDRPCGIITGHQFCLRSFPIPSLRFHPTRHRSFQFRPDCSRFAALNRIAFENRVENPTERLVNKTINDRFEWKKLFNWFA